MLEESKMQFFIYLQLTIINLEILIQYSNIYWLLAITMDFGFDVQRSKQFIEKLYYDSYIPSLVQFIKIPNLSRFYDEQWSTNGLLDKAADHIIEWVRTMDLKDIQIKKICEQGYTPLVYIEIKGAIQDRTIMFYGHFDKQPPFIGWDQGKGPTTPVIENQKLYGRGAADDGYSIYSSILAVKAVQQQNIPLPRITMFIEGDEESGGHIDYYLQKYKHLIRNPEVVFCLDSGTIDYDRLWVTNSVRGFIEGFLTVKVLTQGVHSGDASGIVPSCFRILNMIIGRLQNLNTGQINSSFTAEIPENRLRESEELVKILGKKAILPFPWHGSQKFVKQDPLESVLNRNWKPQLAVVGATGLPLAQTAGNVLLPSCTLKLSIRCPPTLDTKAKSEELFKLLTSNPPYGAHVTFTGISFGDGWNSPAYSKWLSQALSESSEIYFEKQVLYHGQGGSVPFLGILRQMCPQSQFVVTGILGPGSNAHGPNQFLHIPYTLKLTQSIAHILAKSGQIK